MGLFGLPVFHAAVREHGCMTRVRGDVKRRPGQKLTAAVSESVMYRSCSCVAVSTCRPLQPFSIAWKPPTSLNRKARKS